jgi:hypothetical protein
MPFCDVAPYADEAKYLYKKVLITDPAAHPVSAEGGSSVSENPLGNFPATQPQSSLLVAPANKVVLFTGHVRQVLDPLAEEYVPTAHGWHVELLVAPVADE